MTAAGTAKVGPPARRKAAEVHHSRTREPERGAVTQILTSELLRLLDEVLDTFEKVEIAWHLTCARAPLRTSELQEQALLDPRAMRTAIDDLVGARVVELGKKPASTVRLGARARRSDFESLMSLYAVDRPLVVAALTAIAMARIRSMAVRAFSDAFVLRKKNGDPT
jgi:hypothetical protein